MRRGDFIKPNRYKIFVFVLLVYFFLRDYFHNKIYEMNLFIVVYGYPIIMIIVAYLMSCTLLTGIKRLYLLKKELKWKRKEKKNISDFVITRWHFYVITLGIILPQLIIFGKSFGFGTSTLTLTEIVLIYFTYWLIYKNKMTNKK